MPMLPSGLPDEVQGEEDIARFLTQGSHYNAATVKPAAFLPNPRGRETSVSRHGRIPLHTLWNLGEAAAGGRTLHGAAILRAAAIREAGLKIAAAEPPERHAAVRGWPWKDDPEAQKAEQKQLALLLASAAGEPLLRRGAEAP